MIPHASKDYARNFDEKYFFIEENFGCFMRITDARGAWLELMRSSL
jgi:hypothetical protein